MRRQAVIDCGGGYLQGCGLSPQRPVKVRCECTDGAIALGLAEVYPKIAPRAKGDETGLRSDDVCGRSFAPVARPAVVKVPGRRSVCHHIKRALSQVGPRESKAMNVATRKWLSRRHRKPAILANLLTVVDALIDVYPQHKFFGSSVLRFFGSSVDVRPEPQSKRSFKSLKG